MATDDEAFLLFARSATAGLRRFGTAMSGDAHLGEDLTQRALEKVYLRWSKIDEPLAYARQIIVNGCREGWRYRARHPEVIGVEHLPADAYPDPTALLADRDALLQLVARLPTGQRAAVLLRHWFDLSETETARILGISVGTVKSQTSRALAHLNHALTDPDPALTPTRRNR